MIGAVVKSCYFELNRKAMMKISNGTRHRILTLQKKLLMTSTNATRQSLNEQSNEQSMKQLRKELKLPRR